MSGITDVQRRPRPGARGRGVPSLGGPANGLRSFAQRHRSLTIIVGMALVTALLPVIVTVPPFSGFESRNVWMSAFAGAGVFVLLALGLNIVVGLAGLLDLGYAAFFAIGAYAYAFTASPQFGLDFPFWPMLLVGAMIAATFGILLGAPTLRLRGDYLAIVTLGFGEIVPILFKELPTEITGGVNGLSGIGRPEIGSYTFPLTDAFPYYVTMAVIVTFTIIAIYRLQDSRLGRAWMAVREDELAAASNGVNTITTKLLAFALGASTAGFAGVFATARATFVSPEQFLFTVSFTILAMVVLGGMGNIWGVAIGAFIIFITQTVLLKQLNRFMDAFGVPILSEIDFIEYQYLLYGLALVIMMLWRPEGLFPSQRRKRELHEGQAKTGDGAPNEAGSLGAAPQ